MFLQQKEGSPARGEPLFFVENMKEEGINVWVGSGE
jgi:hypothetical protein